MYKKILVALENSLADETLIRHVAGLAQPLHSELLLVHVSEGFAARNFNQLQLAESEEIKADRAYLEVEAEKLREQGLSVDTQLAMGEPPKEIVKVAEQEKCDLIAMGGHGHRLIGDLIYGSAIHVVRHHTSIPVLLVRAGQQ